MVDITEKPTIHREASAVGIIKLHKETLNRIKEGKVEKGNPLEAAKIAGIMAAKNTSQIIPLCHPIPVTYVDIKMETLNEQQIQVRTTVKTLAQTGVEMEALTATATALLTIWDMTKKYEKNKNGQYPETEIHSIKVELKTKREAQINIHNVRNPKA